MRRSAAALGILVALVAAGAAQAKTVRVHTVGPRFDLGWVDSREHFAAKLDGMMQTLPRLGKDRDLVVLPEDLGLMAAFSGPKGATARESDTLIGAVATLLGTYGPQIAYYQWKYPGLGDRGIPTRALALALTDTFNRVAVETFSELADRYDVWLEAGVNMARDWNRTTDPGTVAALGEPGRDYAYEATSDEPVNMALVFDPDGKLVSKQVKAYLTPIELPGNLDLVPGSPRGLTAVDTPVGRLGFVTSKDAWMPDVTGRLDDAGVEILVQPEFFVGDVVSTDPTLPWAPDTLKASGYSDLLRHPSLKAMALPELTGNVFDFAADAQSHIAVRPSPGGPSGGLVGQDPAPGFAQVQPWPGPDPAGLPIEERRKAVVAANAPKAEGVLSQDVVVGETPERQPVKRRRDKPIAPSSTPQRHVALTRRGRTVLAAWEEGSRIRTARYRRGRWSRPQTRGRGSHPALSGAWLAFTRPDGKVVAARGNRHLRPVAPGGGKQERVSIAALRGGGAYAAWLDDLGDSGIHVYGGRVGKGAKRLDGDVEPVELAAQMDNSWAPSVAAQGRRVLVTWTGFANYKWDVFSRASTNRGASFGSAERVNDSPDADEALDDTPRAAFEGGKPFVAWTDFRKRAGLAASPLYDIYGARAGGGGFPNRQLDDDGARQVPAFAPATAGLPRGRLAVAWQAHQGPTADVRITAVGGRARRVDDAGTRNVNSWRPAVVHLSGRRVLVAWEDDRDGPANVFARTLVLPSAPSP